MFVARLGLVACLALGLQAIGWAATAANLPALGAPHVRTGLGPSAVVLDVPRATAYVANLLSGTVTVVDLRHCSTTDTRGCPSAAVASITVGTAPDGLGVDGTRQTLYVANSGDGTVSVVDVRHCRAGDTAGCRQRAVTAKVGNAPADVAIDSARATAYVSDTGANSLSVLDLRHCHAGDVSGCNAAPASVSVGSLPAQPAFDPDTLTVYVTLLGEGKVAVVDARRCFAADHDGCSQPEAKVSVGLLPSGITVVSGTRTAYVANDGSGTVSVLDLRTCDAGQTSGCAHAAASVRAGLAPDGIAVDPLAQVLYATDQATATVSRVSTSSCRAGVITGCKATPSRVRVGLVPFSVAANPATATAYVANAGSSKLSVIGPARSR